MNWFEKANEAIKKTIRKWLNIQPSSPYNIQITEVVDFEINAIRNRVWYRGDSNELEQMYQQAAEYADKYKFWACRSTPGMEMRKIHTGLPSLIVRMLASIVLADMNDFEFSSEGSMQKQLWEEIEKDNKFRKMLEEILKEALVVGDGAFKIMIDTEVSQYPIIEWVSGERIEYVYRCGRLHEVAFKSHIDYDHKTYTLLELYGYGSIRNELYLNGKKVDIGIIKSLIEYKDFTFSKELILAVPFRIFDSSKWKNRGGSIFDGKLDSFDAFDEVWSQWMDALRAGRARTYIPESYIPRNQETGEIMKPNPFDNRFISGDDNMQENGKNAINTEQPDIPHDSYMASYTTALDLCLQGIISPSTLGIDVKKLDNAEAQREKEKATLYTRNAIVETMQEILPSLVENAINAYHVLHKQNPEKVQVTIPFGEYANPSFESQVETVAKGRQGGIMSIEACVEELYGASKKKKWKEEEIARLKDEQGIASVPEPALNMEAIAIHGGGIEADSSISLLNGAQIASLLNIIAMVKNGNVSRSEAISIITSTLGISKNVAETFIEERL